MKMVALGDIVTIKGGGTPDKSEPKYWGGDVPWASVKDFKSTEISSTIDSITDLGVVNSATNLIPAGNLLVPTRMAVGKVAINTIDLAINQDIKALFVNSKIDKKYLLHALLANAPVLERQATGATVKGITLEVLRALEIPLPPLDEQRRIAAILDQADALRRVRRRAIERLNDLGQAIFHEMFGDPDKTSNYKYPLVELSELCRKITDGTHQPPKWSPIGIPFIFVSNVRNQKISLDTQKFVSVETYQELTKNTPIEKGDVLYTAVGSYGNAAEVITDTAFVFQRHIAHIKPNPAKLNPTFLSYLLESPYLRRQADSNAKGIAQKTVTLADIKSFKVPLVPIAEQEQFALSLENMHSLMKRFDCGLRKTDALFSSLQNRAFRGEL